MAANPFFEDWDTPFELPPFDRIAPEHFPPAFDRGMAEQKAEIAAIAGAAGAAELRQHGRGAGAQRRGCSTGSAGSSSNLDVERDQRRARRDRPRLRAEARRAPRRAITLDAGAVRAHRRAPRRARDARPARPTSCACSSATICASSAAGALLGPRAEGAHGRDLRAGWRRCTRSSGRTCCTTRMNGSCARRGRSRRPARFRPRRGRRGGGGARSRRQIRHHAGALLGRAVPDLLGAARSAPARRTRPGRRAASMPGAHDNRAADPRDHRRCAPSRRGCSAIETTPITGSTTRWRRRRDSGRRPAARRSGSRPSARPRPSAPSWPTLARADGLNEPIAPWDWRYYAEKVRQAEIRYRRGRGEAVFRARQHGARRVRHRRPAVRRQLCRARRTARSITRMCAPTRCATPAGRAIGLFLHDNFARPGKRSGAWMSSYRDQEMLDGEVLPIVVNNNNFAKGDPTLLSFDDARTLVPRIRPRAARAAVSRVRYPSQSGTAVRRDFRRVSVADFRALDVGAGNPARAMPGTTETGEPLPEALLRQAARRAQLQPGLCHGRIHRLRAARPRAARAARRRRRSISARSSASSWSGSACRRRSGCATARRISSTCSPAAAMRPGTTPICGPRCSTPTASPPSPKPGTLFDPGSGGAAQGDLQRRRHAPTRWSSTALSAAASRPLTPCSRSAASLRFPSSPEGGSDARWRQVRGPGRIRRSGSPVSTMSCCASPASTAQSSSTERCWAARSSASWTRPRLVQMRAGASMIDLVPRHEGEDDWPQHGPFRGADRGDGRAGADRASASATASTRARSGAAMAPKATARRSTSPTPTATPSS